MKASTHKAITAAVARALGVGGQALEAMLKGSVDPDVYPEEEVEARVGRRGKIYFVRRRIRHHTTQNRSKIMNVLWRSRRLFLKGRMIEAAYLLGYALHYAQDMFIPAWNHAGSELALKSTPIPIWEVKEAVREAACSPSYVERILMRVRPIDGAVALTEAARASAMIAAAVLGPTEPPKELLEAMRAEKRSHIVKVAIASSSAALIVPSFMLFPLIAPLFLITAVVSYLLDWKYRRIKKELKWFKKPRK